MTATLRAFTIVLATVVASQAWAAGLSVHAVRYVMGAWCDLVIFDSDPAPDVVRQWTRDRFSSLESATYARELGTRRSEPERTDPPRVATALV